MAVRRERTADDGIALIEVLLVATLAISLAAMAVPFTARSADAHKARAAAGYLAAQIRTVRHQAIARNRATAVVFDLASGKWTWRVCADANGNGVRRADISAGRDSCSSVAQVFSAQFPGVFLALDPGIPGIDEAAGRSDGVRFGPASMASCSALGHCSPGTLYVRSAGGQQFAVRVGGVTGRTRILRFDIGTGQWRL